MSASFPRMFAPQRRSGVRRSNLCRELRRISMNLVGEDYGVYRRAVYLSATRSSHVFKPREAAIGPFVIIITPAHFQIHFTLGSFAEVPARRAKVDAFCADWGSSRRNLRFAFGLRW
jgi:hypothetical protein